MKMLVQKSTIVVFSIILTLSSFAVTAAQETSEPEPSTAASGTQIVIRPSDKPDGSRFDATVNPGETVELNASIQNLGTEPIMLRTFTSNVIPAVNGGLKMADREVPLEGSGLWLQFETREFELQPGEEILQPLVITVPEGTEPGEYVNAVALETVDPVKDDGSMFRQYFRKAVSVYITVPGESKPSFEIGSAEVILLGDMSVIQIPIANTGNVRIDIDGTVSLYDSAGTLVFEGPVSLAPIYNGQQTVIQVPFGSVLEDGDYSVSFEFADTNSGVSQTGDKMAASTERVEEGAADPIQFQNVDISANADPIAFANVSVDVTVAQSNFSSTRLTLIVTRDGEPVEEFVLADNLALPQGTTTVTQRYIPATNWETGTYSFSLRLESTEGGQTGVLLEVVDVVTLEVP